MLYYVKGKGLSIKS